MPTQIALYLQENSIARACYRWRQRAHKLHASPWKPGDSRKFPRTERADL